MTSKIQSLVLVLNSFLSVYLWSWRQWYRNRHFINLFQLEHEPEPEFPQPSGINVNMMPFIASEKFEKCRLPDNLKPYWGLINYCLAHKAKRNRSSYGRVFYLTIQETGIEEGSSQRRPGLHVEYRGQFDNASSKRLVAAFCQKQILLHMLCIIELCHLFHLFLGTNNKGLRRIIVSTWQQMFLIPLEFGITRSTLRNLEKMDTLSI